MTLKFTHKILLACVPVLALSACGGGDTEDRLDVADPVVRFVDASQTAPNVTLYRAAVAQSDATNVGYQFASNYFDVDLGVADWTVKSVVDGSTVGGVSIDPQRGTKYTIVTLATSATTNAAYLISDPYNKPLTSDSTHLRVMNAAYNGGSVDVYMNAPGTDITAAGVNPLIAATAFNASGPAPGQDSVDIPGGSYQLTITSAGTKTVLFRGSLSFAANQDVLLLTVPNGLTAGSIKALVKVEGTAGATAIPAT